MIDELARMRARRAATAAAARKPRPGVAKLRLNEDLDIELDYPGLDAVLVWSPELGAQLARQILRLSRIAKAARTRGDR